MSTNRPLFTCVVPTKNNNNPVPLFPSVVASSSNEPSKPNDGSDLNENLSRILPQCSSFNPEVFVSDQNSEDAEEPASIEVIDLSSVEDVSDDSSSDSSVIEIISEYRKRRHHRKSSKKKKKHRNEDEKERKKKHKKHKKHKKKKSKQQSDLNQSNDSVQFSNSYLDYIPKGWANFIDDIPNLKPEDAFRIDRRGDRNNLAFDKLYERYVPKYIQKEVINLYKNEDPKPEAKKSKNKRYYSSRKQKQSEANNFVYPQENLFTEITNLDFIRVADDLVPQAGSIVSTDNFGKITFDSLRDSEEPSHRTISPRMFPSHQQLIIELTKIFNKNLYEEKTNVEKWIDFIRFQDLIYHYGGAQFKFSEDISAEQQPPNEISDNKLYKLCVEKKLDICNKALDHNRRSVKLNLLRLRLLSSFSDELQLDCSEIDAEWKNLCFLFPNAPELWFEWIYYSLRCERMIGFRANNRTRKIFRQAFNALSKKLLEGNFQLHQIENLEWILINLTYMLAEFLASIDQTEKAIGLFQALIEFNLNTPDEIDFNLSFEDWFMLFEQFWDSGVSRIGEFAHITDSGWKYFQQQMIRRTTDKIRKKDERNFDTFSTQQLTDRCEDQIVQQVCDKISNQKPEWIKSLCWLHMEMMRHTLHWLPASVQLPTNHSMDDIEDPERIVLSDEDIKPFLYRLRKIHSKFYLSLKFLQFLGLNLITNSLDSAFSTSHLELEFHLESIFQIDEQNCSVKSWFRLFEVSKKFQPRFENYSEMFVLKRYGLESVADGRYATFAPLCDDLVQECGQVWQKSSQAFMDNVFEKLCKQFQNDQQYRTSLYLLWIHYKIDLFKKKVIEASAVKKMIKEILKLPFHQKIDNTSLHFYNVYGCFLFGQDVHEAIKVFLTTMQACIDSSNEISGFKIQILRLGLSFVRNLLNLDSIVDQFINNDHSNQIELLPQSNRKHSIPVGDLKQIAVNTLVAITLCCCESKPGTISFNLDEMIAPSKQIAVLKAIASIEAMWANRKSNRKHLEEIHTNILLLYLCKDFETTEEFIEQQLLPDSMDLIDFQTPYIISKPLRQYCLERSFYIIFIQLMLREYVGNKQSTFGTIRLQQIRQLINRALISFPDDPVFLAILAKIETKFNVLTRTRKFFNDYVAGSVDRIRDYLVQRHLNEANTSNPSLLDQTSSAAGSVQNAPLNSMYNIFMATLHSELLILDKSTSTDLSSFDFNNGMTNRIRHFFQRALNYKNDKDSKSFDWFSGRSLAHCPTIWRLYIRFEEKERKMRKAPKEQNTALIYHALQMCPNHKPLYLDFIALDPNRLQECVDVMMDQQLRVRTTIEEIDLFINSRQNSNEDTSINQK